jgi:tRNA-splicing ligase RtcB
MIKKTISPLYQLGSLGGGNHFIELNVDSQENVWATVHTGSRNFGHKIATHFQAKAKEACHEMGVTTPKGLEYLPMSFGGCLYLEAEHTAQTYAHMNRTVIISVIASFFGIEPLWMHTKEEDAIIESVHNYIGDDGIIRKGAISAKQGEKVVIPLTMKRGIVIGTGKGNKDFNYSAPHGCGRVHGRKAMDRLLASSEITMDQYRDSMQGIFSTSICEATIDECDAAYKDFDQIRIDMEPTVDIEEVLRPIYSLKDDSKRDKKAKVL